MFRQKLGIAIVSEKREFFVSGSSRDPARVPQAWPSSLYPCVPDFHHLVSSASVTALGHGELGTVVLLSSYFVRNIAMSKIISLLYLKIKLLKRLCGCVPILHLTCLKSNHFFTTISLVPVGKAWCKPRQLPSVSFFSCIPCWSCR